MAKIFVLDQQNTQVGTVDFVFSKDRQHSYLFVDINVNYAATLGLRESTVLDATGKPIASLVCGSNGKNAYGNLTPVGRNFPAIGLIQESKAQIMQANAWRVLGGVTQNYVRSDTKGVVGQLSMHWGSGDEEFYQQFMQDFVGYSDLPADRARALSEGIRPVVYQNMMNFAGCAALIMRLFEQKKRGWFG